MRRSRASCSKLYRFFVGGLEEKGRRVVAVMILLSSTSEGTLRFSRWKVVTLVEQRSRVSRQFPAPKIETLHQRFTHLLLPPLFA